MSEKKFDIEKSKLVGIYEEQMREADGIGYISISLYQKSTGEFFRRDHYSNGKISDYNRFTSLSIKEAREWAQGNLSPEDYKNNYEPAERIARDVVKYSLHENTINQIEKLAKEWHCSTSDVIENLVNGKSK